MLELCIIITALLAVASPLLTISYLWQLKEWRFDRLKVHLKEARTLNPLLNLKKIIIAGIGIASVQLNLPTIGLGTLLLLVGLNAIQLITNKQPLPVWTHKAKLFVAVTYGLNVFVLANAVDSEALLQIALALAALQAITTYVSWLLLYPIDTLLKRRILAQATALRNNLQDCQVIGITGSVGKTTVKEVLKTLTNAEETWVTPEHVNTEIGIAQWFIHKMNNGEPKPAVLVIEMGAYRIGEIALMCRIFKPTIGIITKIGTQHIALFGSQEKLLHAKSELFVSVPSSGHVLTNGDDLMTRQTLKFTNATTHTIGMGTTNTTIIESVQNKPETVSFTLEKQAYTSHLVGKHSIVNVGLAIKASLLLGIAAPTIAERLATVRPHTKTFSIETIGNTLLVDDTHNTSPSSAHSAVEWAKDQVKPVKILFFSGFIEQGSYQKKSHEELGAACNDVFDQIFCTNKIATEQLQNTFKGTVIYCTTAPAIPTESLVVCEGRIPAALLVNIRSKIVAT